jgi:hypothetical protein
MRQRELVSEDLLMSNLKSLNILFAVVVAAMATPASAAPHVLRGDEFITVMQDNTLSGRTTSGTAFDIYFLPGGAATYREATGTHDTGSWHLDSDGDVCVAWRNPREVQQGCFRVAVDGHKVTWQGKTGSSRAALRGDITETFLKSARQ